MFKILNKKRLTPDTVEIEIQAPRIAKNALAGQFLVLRTHEEGERIPLTIADKTAESVTIVVQEIGASTKILGKMNVNEMIKDVLGPLGHPTDIKKFGTVVCIGGGVGIAVVYPVVKAMKEKGNRVLSIIGARSEDLLIFREEVDAKSDEMYITTDDGTCGMKGFVSDQLKKLIDEGIKIARVITVGPVPMMRAVTEVTRPYKIKTIASLNAMMLDGTGMCGGCRVLVGNTKKFSCVDGPEFDAHEIDFNELSTRLGAYKTEEQTALEKCEACSS